MKFYHKPSIKGFIKNYWNFLFVISTGKSLNDKAINYWSFIIDLIELLIVQARFVFVSKKTSLAIRGSFTSYVYKKRWVKLNYFRKQCCLLSFLLT